MPKSQVNLLVRAALLMAGGAVVACTSIGEGLVGPKPGHWEGPTISFVLAEGVVSAWRIQGIGCQGDNGCVQGGTGWTAPTSVAVENGGFEGTVDGGLLVTGRFETATSAAGTFTYVPGACCSASGTWTAAWSATADTSPTGSATGGGGAVPRPAPEPGTDFGVSETASPYQLAALARANWYRRNVGLALLNGPGSIGQAAQAHADYYAAHVQDYLSGAIPGGTHKETAAIAEGFTGQSFSDRMAAAGYPGGAAYEVMAFVFDGAGAVDEWMETVYHRIPFVSPDVGDAGAGGAKAVDVMDFGGRVATDMSQVILYPWPGQTDVTRGWHGAESPQPPAPPNGYPSGPIVTATTARGAPLEISTHQLLNAAAEEIPHVWHPKGSVGFMAATWALYANDPLEPLQTYTVRLEGTLAGAAWSREWSFVTGL